MTLQQKLLAKQSKKGFTLVELVVVIAILGILAAIAIPAVIGIISSANESQAKSDASSLNTACKNMYAEIVAGTINASNAGTIQQTGANRPALPAANASASARVTGALAATVQQAIDYAGLTALEGKVGDFKVDLKTQTIYADVDKSYSGGSAITLASTMSDLGYKNTNGSTATPAASTP